MNFLLHRHLGARDLGTTAAGVGAMLPDLWRMADRRVRPRAAREALPATAGSAPLVDLLLGIEHHVVADRWFHSDPVFVEGEREAVDRLRHAQITARRTTLFAHVLWELCLDGELLRREGLDRITRELQGGLECTQAALAASAEIHHFSRVVRTGDERFRFERRLARICLELASGSWIDGYQTGEGIAARLQGLRSRLGLDAMSPDDASRLAAVADALLVRAADALDRILAMPSFSVL